jgi:hypothetical protein
VRFMGRREHRLRARMTIDCHETAVQIDVLRPRAGPVASRVTLAGHRLIRGGGEWRTRMAARRRPSVSGIDRRASTADLVTSSIAASSNSRIAGQRARTRPGRAGPCRGSSCFSPLVNPRCDGASADAWLAESNGPTN